MSYEIKKVSLLGITGRTGYQLGIQLLEKNIRVKALVRNRFRNKITHPFLEILEGNPENENDLKQIIEATDAVISVLGYTKNSPAYFQARFLQKLIPIMENSDCKRIILLTGSGVSFENDINTPGNKIVSFFIKNLAKTRFMDGIFQLEELKKTNLDWTVFRCPLLTNSLIKEQNVYIGNHAPGFLSSINRATVSNLIINELENKQFVRRAVFAYVK